MWALWLEFWENMCFNLQWESEESAQVLEGLGSGPRGHSSQEGVLDEESAPHSPREPKTAAVPGHYSGSGGVKHMESSS